MLVERMTNEEVQKEVLEDFENAMSWASHHIRRVSKVARNTTTFPCVHYMEYTSPKKNKWLVGTILYRRNIHNQGAGMFGVCIQKADRGYNAHAVYLNYSMRPYVKTVLAHAFDQYALRVGVKKKGVELVKHFFAKNYEGDTDYTKELSGKGDRERENDNAHVCMNEGVLMGEVINEQHVIMHTFITYDMTWGKQGEVFRGVKDMSPDAWQKHKEAWRAIYRQEM